MQILCLVLFIVTLIGFLLLLSKYIALYKQNKEAKLRFELQLEALREQEELKISSQEKLHETKLASLRKELENEERRGKETQAELEKQFKGQIAALKDEFKVLSETILKERSSALIEVNNSQLTSLLQPLKEKLADFNLELKETRDKNVAINSSLAVKLDEMAKTSLSLGQEANQLSQALRGSSKIQGDWGEFILEELLQRSGLQPEQHYFTQNTIRDESGQAIRHEESKQKLRPDVIVNFPDGKSVIIDSKVSLTAYTDYINAEPGSDEAKNALKRHVESVRKHFQDLAQKDYAHYHSRKTETVDFVIMFMPLEGAYQLLMQSEPCTWQDAFDKRIILVNPVAILALLKMIHIAWRRDEQAQNQAEIMTEVEKLLERVQEFCLTMEELGTALKKTDLVYQKALKKMSGDGRSRSIAVSGKRLEELGVKSKNQYVFPVNNTAIVEAAENEKDMV
jgi:DNA recombination protein RmuC